MHSACQILNTSMLEYRFILWKMIKNFFHILSFFAVESAASPWYTNIQVEENVLILSPAFILIIWLNKGGSSLWPVLS